MYISTLNKCFSTLGFFSLCHQVLPTLPLQLTFCPLCSVLNTHTTTLDSNCVWLWEAPGTTVKSGVWCLTIPVWHYQLSGSLNFRTCFIQSAHNPLVLISYVFSNAIAGCIFLESCGSAPRKKCCRAVFSWNPKGETSFSIFQLLKLLVFFGSWLLLPSSKAISSTLSLLLCLCVCLFLLLSFPADLSFSDYSIPPDSNINSNLQSYFSPLM